MFDRKKQLMWSKLRVGIVITMALLILLLTVLFAGSIEKIFSSTEMVQARIQNVNGLRMGAPVWFSGVEVGTVQEISLDPHSGTVVSLAINKDQMGLIKNDAVATVLTIGLLGDKYIDLSAGSPKADHLRPGDVLQGAAQLEMKDMMEIATTSIKNMNDFIGKLDLLVSDIRSGGGTLSKLIKDPDVYDNLREASQSFSQLMEDINRKKGTLGMLVKDPSLYEKLADTSGRINDLLQKLDTTVGSVDTFARKLNTGSGSLNRLIEDPQLYDNLSAGSQQLTQLLERVNRGEGAAGVLLKDEETAVELRSTIKELRQLFEDLKTNPRKYFKFSVF
ncbi:MAG: MCE family protein [Nitrospirales bacterium]|nr:MCE family protein [Nitrospirales bacterium]